MMTINRKTWRRAVLAAAAFVATAAANAVTYYWDVNGATAGAGGPAANGAWNGANAYWNTDATGGGGGSFTAAVGAADTLYFSAGGDATGTSTVTVVGTQIFGGTVKPVLQDGSVILTGGTLKISNGAEVTSGGTLTIGSQIDTSAATGSLGVGYGKVVYSNANNTSSMNFGTWIYGGGKLSVSVPGALGNGSDMLSWGGVPYTNIVSVIEQNTTLEFTGTTPITLNRSVGIYNGGAGVQTVDVQNLAGVTISGNIGAVFGGVFDKKGPGTLILTGTVSGLNSTEVVTGALQVDGTMNGSSWGVFVKPGGILQGTGTINDYVELDGGVLAPGASIGTLTITNNAKILNAGSAFRIEVGGAGSADRLNVSGNLDLSVSGDRLELFTLGSGMMGGYTILSWGTRNGFFDEVYLNGVLQSNPFVAGGIGGNYMFEYVNNTLFLIPEPASISILALGCLALIRRKR